MKEGNQSLSLRALAHSKVAKSRGTTVDMAKQVDWVRVKSVRLQVKNSHFKRVKTDSGQSGCKLGRIDLYFSHEFFFKRKQHVVAI